MKIGMMLVCLLIMLTGCVGNTQPSKVGHNSVKSLTGEPVREVSAYGFVTQILAEKRIITIKHAPIPEMNWAPMVMPFNVADDVDLSPFGRGDKVEFVLDIDKDKNYRIKTLSVVTSTP